MINKAFLHNDGMTWEHDFDVTYKRLTKPIVTDVRLDPCFSTRNQCSRTMGWFKSNRPDFLTIECPFVLR